MASPVIFVRKFCLAISALVRFQLVVPIQMVSKVQLGKEYLSTFWAWDALVLLVHEDSMLVASTSRLVDLAAKSTHEFTHGAREFMSGNRSSVYKLFVARGTATMFITV